MYNIFAFAMLFPTIWIFPRLTESLHPGGQGSKGNPGLNADDLTPSMRHRIFGQPYWLDVTWRLDNNVRIRFIIYKERI